MDVTKYYWECPNCHAKVNALESLVNSCFDEENGEAWFMVEKDCGLWFHTISCSKCKAEWVLSISGMILE